MCSNCSSRSFNQDESNLLDKSFSSGIFIFLFIAKFVSTNFNVVIDIFPDNFRILITNLEQMNLLIKD